MTSVAAQFGNCHGNTQDDTWFDVQMKLADVAAYLKGLA
jgi:hypothetical protein